MKTLRICLFKEIPNVLERDSDYFYFAYDKLLLFRGQNPYYDPFVICEAVPANNPIPNCLYILFDGSVKAYVDYSVVDVAEIEDASQAEHLSDIGTTYYTMSNKRYLDQNFRTLHLPYLNGTYDLTVSLANDIKVDENCIIRYDPTAERWYIEGDHTPRPPRFYPLTGAETKSATTEVEKHHIRTNVKLSSKSDNILQFVSGGLYATLSGQASSEEYASLVSAFESYKLKTDALLAQYEELVSGYEGMISEDSILSMIISALSDYSDDIEGMIEFYNSVGAELEKISNESMSYTDAVFAKTQTEIEALIYSTYYELKDFGVF